MITGMMWERCRRRPKPKNHGIYSIVFQTVCDANFAAIDTEAYRFQSGGGIMFHSEYERRLVQNGLELAETKIINIKFPYYFVSDAPFPLRCNLIRSYTRDSTKARRGEF
ncbi:uncharacterized protein LOC119640701 isoform X1 [Glossina fuscipes]|uniref:Uncharacterized protein LOC119640701 isoform X1 n=1 Tax=Glossina fuscipes TaxID=7396 RepID=A0A9C5ZA27_9MUSC|nr:uncharacterized protein LOC119640701 isoform X1 [Glossina fuscipes]